jgi:hypothetical protein
LALCSIYLFILVKMISGRPDSHHEFMLSLLAALPQQDQGGNRSCQAGLQTEISACDSHKSAPQ